MDTLVISIGADGSCASLHNDKFDLGFLGPKKVYRQSDIRFDEETQKWDIIYLDGTTEFHDSGLYGFSTYEEARQAEVRWLNLCREFNLEPTLNGGLSVMYLVREGTEEITVGAVLATARKLSGKQNVV